MKLYELAWGLYPRRISIYLAEKGIDSIERIAFDALKEWPPKEVGKMSPMGTLPILQTENGVLIRSSVAILEYLEERFPSPNMLGASAEERARTRELVGLWEEATIQFNVWTRHASQIFARVGDQSLEAAQVAADAYYRRLKFVDALIGETSGPFMVGENVTIADCIGVASLQFAQNCYSAPIGDECPTLSEWYRNFSLRPSAATPDYPAPYLALSQGLLSSCAPSQMKTAAKA